MDLLKGSLILSRDPWTYIPSLATKLLLKSTDNDRSRNDERIFNVFQERVEVRPHNAIIFALSTHGETIKQLYSRVV